MGKKSVKVAERGFYLEDEISNNALVIETLDDVTLGMLAEGYHDDSENVSGGVYGWNNKLEIRPKFQRAFVVDGNISWQTALVHSVLNGRPTGTMYFGLTENGKTYINIDGQQRLMTLCSFINGDLTLKMYIGDNKTISVNFENLKPAWQERIKNYKPTIKLCKGSEDALLQWFKTINQPISELTQQELKNAANNGTFVEAAKRIFAVTKKTANLTKENGPIMDDSSKYCYKRYFKNLQPERQDVLEAVLDWVSYRDYKDCGDDMSKDSRIETYMILHRRDTDANDLYNHYKNVIDWVNDIFFHNYTPNSKSWGSIQAQDWNRMYLEYNKETSTYTDEQKQYITNRCKDLVKLGFGMFQNTKGIYEWVLRGEKIEEEGKYLCFRTFELADRHKMFDAQGGIDPITGKHYDDLSEMEAHHIVAWRNGGLTEYDNLVLLSKESHTNLDSYGLKPEDVKRLRDNLRECVKRGIKYVPEF